MAADGNSPGRPDSEARRNEQQPESAARRAEEGRPARCVVLAAAGLTRAGGGQRQVAGGGAALDPAALASKLLAAGGHEVVERGLLPAGAEAMRRLVLERVETGEVDVIIVAGGTGLGAGDVSPEAVMPLFTFTLDGFGEALRRLLFSHLGPGALLSRAVAGVVGRTLVFAVPDSELAIRLAVGELIRPMLDPALRMLRPEGGVWPRPPDEDLARARPS